MKRISDIRRLSLFFLPFIMLLCCMVPASADETEEGMPDNGIPVVYINVDESQGTIEDMIGSGDHSVYCYGTVSIDVPEGFQYADLDLPCESVTELAMSIRGRGNSTWQRADKKAFKIKLDKKTDIFGLGKNKHWVLLANALDETLIRDRITAWLADQMCFEFTHRGVPVDLVMIGSEYGTHYLGSYYLSENVRVDENRLEIDELTESDTEEPAITGGYLVQHGLQVVPWSPDRFTTDRGVIWATHTPSFDVEGDSLMAAEETEPVEEENFVGAELSVSPSALSSLSAGGHAFTAVFDDGMVLGKLTVTEDKNMAPDTSDSRDSSTALILGGSLLIAAAAFGIRKYYRNR